MIKSFYDLNYKITLCQLNVHMSIVPLCPVHGTPGNVHGAPGFFLKISFVRETTKISA